MLPRTRTLRGLTQAALAGALILVSAASVSAQQAQSKESGKSKRNEVTLAVQNDNYWDMHVYAMRDGAYWSLGFAPGLSHAKFTIPEFMTAPTSDFQILAKPVGSNVSYMTGPILMGTANEIDLTLQNDLVFSSFLLRDRTTAKGTG